MKEVARRLHAISLRRGDRRRHHERHRRRPRTV